MTPAYQSALETLPLDLQEETARYLQDIPAEIQVNEQVPVQWLKNWPATLVQVITASPYVAQLICRKPWLLLEQINNGSLFRRLSLIELERAISGSLADIENEQTLSTALRQIRNEYSLRIAWRDLAGWADLDETLTELSNLADVLVKATLEKVNNWSVKKYGVPTGEFSGQPVSLCIFALGKLGGNELNFSSDIDLIFFYPEDGETRHTDKAISNHEFFVRSAKQLIKILNEHTKDGFVFRVDMRLRPNGKVGPLAMSFFAAEQYYITHGREWERYAWIKARLMAGDEKRGGEFLDQMRPFVYRKYLDYGAIEAIRSLKKSINLELKRKKILHDIKRGPGGIREIEFIGQVFQLIRGGRDLHLQQRSILRVLDKLKADNFITPRAVTELSIAYDFLRRSEHRLQMVNDQQTHTLPQDQPGKARLAFAMGFPDWETYKKNLDKHMGHVHSHFDLVIAAPQREQEEENDTGLMSVWSGELDEDEAISVLQAHGYHTDPKHTLNLLNATHNGSAYAALTGNGRERIDRLIPLLLAAAGSGEHSEKTLARLLNVLEAIGRRSAYLALLVENPLALSQLVQLCSASSWIAEWIAQHPLLLDELLNPVGLSEHPSKEILSEELSKLIKQQDGSDPERMMEVLREFCNRHVLRLAAAEVGPGLDSSIIGKGLSDIADVLINSSLQFALAETSEKFGQPQCISGDSQKIPGFVVIGYGKLGGHELGFGSDVDIIFLYDYCDEGETNGKRSIPNETFFTRVSKKLIHILSTRTYGGILYEVDARLRPSGTSGPIVTSLEAFTKYQETRAWVWEIQALVRARPVAGDKDLAAAFVKARQRILCQKRDAESLRVEVSEMRAKMMAAQKPHAPEKFDVKHDRGGIVDVEFMVQYWVLAWAHDFPELTLHTDNNAILKSLARAGLIKLAQAELLTNAYQYYLSTAYHLKLMQAGPRVDRPAGGSLDGYPDKVAKLWHEVMEQAGNKLV